MANLQIRVDDTLKARADSLFAGIGMDTSTAVRVFLKQSVMRGGIPFALTGDPYLPYLREADARQLDEAFEREKRRLPLFPRSGKVYASPPEVEAA